MEDLEIHLLASLIRSGRGELADPDAFEDELISSCAGAIRKVWEATGKLPDRPALLAETLQSLPPGRKPEEAKKLIRRVWEADVPNPEYYLAQAGEHAERIHLSRGIREADLLLAAGDVKAARDALLRASIEGAKFTGPPIPSNGAVPPRDYLGGTESRIKRYRGSEDSKGRIPTGIGPLDSFMKGGLGPGELGVLAGLAGYGKSTFLVNVGKNALMAGATVLHVSLENSKSVVEERYDTCLTGMSGRKLRRKPKTFRRTLRKLLEGVKGKLTVEFAPAKTLGRAELTSLCASHRPTLLIVDYAALMRPSRTYEERRFQLIDVFEGLRSVGGRLGVPTWTVHQSNRMGIFADRPVLGMENFAECFEIPAIADVALTWNQTRKDVHRGEALIRIVKNRIGPSEVSVAVRVDREVGRIETSIEEELNEDA